MSNKNQNEMLIDEGVSLFRLSYAKFQLILVTQS